ncbi:MAG: MarR family transcriptional regulator [Thiohalomonas sp.]|nr:MarR family transcriptional regulator [Thiohalomonas sp.]
MTTNVDPQNKKYTEKQGQYLAFIYYYLKVNAYPPEQADIQRYFNVSPPSVHQMILMLEKLSFIKRKHRTTRCLEVFLTVEECPLLK